MKVVDLELPESGFVIIDCENGNIITIIEPEKLIAGTSYLTERILHTRVSEKNSAI
ncbi:hypothetical protein ACQUW4_001882 [Cronobacter dublinensis]